MDDETAFRQFVAGAWHPLVATAFLVTGDRGLAEDCVQEALTRVHRRWAALRRDGNPHAYTRKAVLNAALAWYRQRGRRVREVPFGSFDRAGPGEPPLPDAGLLDALRALPPRMRAVVVLRYVEDRSERETAELLGCSPGAVKSAASRGLARLRQSLTTDTPSWEGATS
jgi:RNA polymerase sigma-70 factor (sigma-E family)